MGNRGNVCFKTDDDGARVWLYGHHAGDMRLAVQRALALPHAQQRWKCSAYLTRIIISGIIPAGDHNQEYSWGIATHMGDNEHPIVEVDCVEGKVRIVPFDSRNWKPLWDSDAVQEWSFEDFVAADLSQGDHE